MRKKRTELEILEWHRGLTEGAIDIAKSILDQPRQSLEIWRKSSENGEIDHDFNEYQRRELHYILGGYHLVENVGKMKEVQQEIVEKYDCIEDKLVQEGKECAAKLGEEWIGTAEIICKSVEGILEKKSKYNKDQQKSKPKWDGRPERGGII